jgi:hypothetical protein
MRRPRCRVSRTNNTRVSSRINSRTSKLRRDTQPLARF